MPTVGGGAAGLDLPADRYTGVPLAADGRGHHPGAGRRVGGRRSAVGDDRIRQRATGRVNPGAWTPGSSAQRRPWSTTGYRTRDPTRCTPCRGRPTVLAAGRQCELPLWSDMGLF
ncbi:neutral zinc metallopeptidase [Kitasatospora sp. NBC_00374]